MDTSPPRAIAGNPKALGETVRKALEVARERAGLNVDDMVQSLVGYQARTTSGRRSTWYDWRRRPDTIGAVALMRAAEIAGTDLCGLLEEVTLSRGERGEVAQLRQEVAEMRASMEELQRRVSEAARDVYPERHK